MTEVDEGELNPVDIALDICTYKREEYLERNLAKLRRDPAKPRLPAVRPSGGFVSDNGQTLDVSRLSTDGIHIFPNKNVGGAGGFSRGMIEIIDAPKHFSHVLLMDDDVLINSDALVRTYRLLQLLKPEYAGKTIAGSLMRLDNRCVQYENGAVMNSYILKPRKHNLDMRKVNSVLFNEQEETIHYNGWWYSCIPMAKIDNDSLPLPIFVPWTTSSSAAHRRRHPDAERHLPLWHEAFDNKYASSMEYYEVRNDLILNAMRKTEVTSFKLAWELMHRTVGNAIRYRYNNCELMFKGFDDFLAGPDRLIVTDPEALQRGDPFHERQVLPMEELDRSRRRRSAKASRSTQAR